jgi:DnaJ-class molecular chaperone
MKNKNFQNSGQNPINQIMSMAEQIAKTIPKNDDSPEMDLGNVIKHVTESVSSLMKNNELDLNKLTENMVNQMQMQNQVGDGGFDKDNEPKLEPKQIDKFIPKQPVIEKNDEFEELNDDECVDNLQPRTKDLFYDMNISLEEFYSGKIKKLQIKRKRIQGTKIITEKKKIGIEIKKGSREDQIIRLNKQSDEEFNHETGDVVINLIEKPHEIFEREGDNLFTIIDIGLFDSINKNRKPIYIKHLNQKIIKLKVPPKCVLHQNNSTWKIKGYGMPKFSKDQEFGDLFVKFNLHIPENEIDTTDTQKIIENFPSMIKNIEADIDNIQQVELQELEDKDFDVINNYEEDEYSDEDDCDISSCEDESDL